MKQIESSEALKILCNGGIDCAYEADALNVALEDEEELKCLYDNETLILITFYEDTDYVTVIPITKKFDVVSVTDTIKKECNNPSILLNTQRINKCDIDSFAQALGQDFVCDRHIRDLSSDKIIEADYCDDPDVRLLTVDDAEIFCSIDDELAPNRPPVARLFDIFINRGVGKIIGLFSGNTVIGYLSFTQMFGDVYDVDYIYVIPSERSKGHASRLARAYVAYAKKEGKAAYWSSAKNEASEKTAVSVGMNVVREALRFRVAT